VSDGWQPTGRLAARAKPGFASLTPLAAGICARVRSSYYLYCLAAHSLVSLASAAPVDRSRAGV
jgi:hypothetical protein